MPTPAILALLITLLAGVAGWLQPVDQRIHDIGAALGQQTVASDAVIIEIDAASLRELQGWPWPRRHHARLLDRLGDAGVTGIFYDVDFSTASNADDDRLLAEAIARHPPNSIMLPVFIQPARNLDADAMIATYPLADFSAHTLPVSVNLHPDRDGLVRRIPGAERIDGRDAILAGVRMTERYDYLHRTLRIDYTIDPGSFERLSFADVVNGDVDTSRLAGKQVFIGATAIELGDMLPVPVHRSLPGVVVQALAYQTLQQGGLRPLPTAASLAGLLLLFGAMILVFRRSGWRVALAFVITTAALIVALTIHAWQHLGLVVNPAPAIGLLVLGYAFFLITRIEQQHLRLLLQAFDLRRQERRMANIVNSSIDGIVTVSADDLINSANPAAHRLFAATSSELVGRSINDLLTTPPMLDAAEPGATLEGMARRIDGSEFPVELSPAPMTDDDTAWTVVIRDISERRRHLDDLHHQATHDALTGLGNRYSLNEQLTKALSDAAGDDNGSGVSLLVIDLDRFKEINDHLGHHTGDRLLQQVAQRFAGSLADRHADDAALVRLGGDEFAIVLCEDHDDDGGRRLAACLLATLQQPFPVDELALEINASIGIARYPDHARDADELMQHADTAMYVAKRSGIGLTVYRPEFAEHNALRLAISTGLRQAIADRQLDLHYQPKLAISGMANGEQQVVAAEALLRWQHPELGAIRPDLIVEVAEQTGLIWELTEWTLERALDDLQRWHRAGFLLRVAVNLSARLLQDSALVGRITRCLDERGLRHDWLTLEITESAIMADPDTALKNVRALQAAGIRLSIDDFGTGYSSLEYLKNLPVSELKIDKSFVSDMIHDRRDALIVKSTIELAHNLGLEVVAEGIEDQATLDALAALGCEVAQGYFISRPLACERFLAWLPESASRLRSARGKLAACPSTRSHSTTATPACPTPSMPGSVRRPSQRRG